MSNGIKSIEQECAEKCPDECSEEGFEMRHTETEINADYLFDQVENAYPVTKTINKEEFRRYIKYGSYSKLLIFLELDN